MINEVLHLQLYIFTENDKGLISKSIF